MLEKFAELERDFPEEVLFSIEDLVQYYRDYALADERIKDFVERIKEFIEQQSHHPLHYFQYNDRDDFCVLLMDTEQNGQSFDIIVKDLSSGQLTPVLILNAQDEVAFDRE